jgi:thiamine-phosphate pyrophosphorylase
MTAAAHARVRGLYAITPDLDDTDDLVRRVSAAIGGGARLVQYRNKGAGADLALAQVRALLAVTRPAGVPLIVNDSLELALATDADGLHLGGTDGDLAAARRALGPDRLLGASCYNRLELAVAARAAGADHVAFGSVHPSTTKPGAIRASLELFRAARVALDCPICAIGGITADNAPEVIAAGADAVAVITDVFAAVDVRAAAARFVPLFGPNGDIPR